MSEKDVNELIKEALESRTVSKEGGVTVYGSGKFAQIVTENPGPLADAFLKNKKGNSDHKKGRGYSKGSPGAVPRKVQPNMRG